VGNHDVTRLASHLTEPRHLPHALAVLFTVAGSPSVYAGDEQAFRGVKYDRAGGDDEIRPAFPATPHDLAPDGWPTYRLHQDLIGLRRRHPWLARASTEVLTVRNEALAYRAVHPGDGPDLAVLLNVGTDEATFDLGGRAARYLLGSDGVGSGAAALGAAASGGAPSGGVAGSGPAAWGAAASGAAASGGAASGVVEPQGWAILELPRPVPA